MFFFIFLQPQKVYLSMFPYIFISTNLRITGILIHIFFSCTYNYYAFNLKTYQIIHKTDFLSGWPDLRIMCTMNNVDCIVW